MYQFRARVSLSRVTAMNDTFRKWRVRSGVFFALLLTLSASGCAGKPSVAPSTLQMEAIRHNQRGIRAEARGERLRAFEEFAESLRINRSIENSEGMVVSLVNSSRVHRHNGDAATALAVINGAIPLVTPRSPLYSEVAFEMAQALLLSGELNEASMWASKAAAAENGVKRGMMVNLLARTLYLKGTMAEAEAMAREALLLNRENGLREEEANTLRLLGDLQVNGKRRAEAAESFSQALAIDKALGKSRKIAADLRALAFLSQSQSDQDPALVFYRRAFAVSSAGGDWSGAADDLLEMSRIHEKRGEKEQSERLLSERDALLKKTRTP